MNYWGEKSLRKLLWFVGLFGDRPNEMNYLQAFRFSFFILVASAAVIFELWSKIESLLNDHLDKVQLLDVIQSSQYWIRTSAVLVITGLFYGKCSFILATVKQLTTSTDEQCLFGKTNRENLIAGSVILSCTAYILTTGTTRILNIIREVGGGNREIFDILVTYVTSGQSEYIRLFTRNTTEPIRVICAGYLGIFLHRFKRGLAAKCERILSNAIHKKNDPLNDADLQEAWNAREMALTMAGMIQRELGPLLSVILIVDVLCLNACFANFLYPIDGNSAGFIMFHFDDYIRNVTDIVVYLTSLFCVSYGLISLNDMVS